MDLAPRRKDAKENRAAAAPLRWWVKKASRTGLALASSCTTLPLARARTDRACVRVLTYHRFGDARRDPFCVSVRDFEAQMAWLARHRLALAPTDVERFLAGELTLPADRVLVTIDDGFHSLLSAALPILIRYRIPALAFIPVGHVPGDAHPGGSDAHGAPEPRLAWAELAALAEAGVAIGSHAWTHESLGRMSPAALRTELVRSRAVLEERLGREVTAFAYPFGTRADYGAATAALLGSSGYRCAFTSQHGPLRPGMDRFTLPRVKVEGGEPSWMFGQLCRGALDGWRWVDRTLWRLQARGR